MTSDGEPPPVSEVLAEFRSRKGDLWAFSADMDIQTALALARAVVSTLLELSAESHALFVQALTREVQVLEQQGDAMSTSVAAVLKQYFPDR